MRARVLVAAGLVALTAGCGAGSPANAPGRGLKEDDQRWAEGSLPTADAVPSGWDVGADDRGAALDDCGEIDLSDLTVTGESIGTYARGERILAILGSQVFPSVDEAAQALERGDDDAWAACLEEEVAEAFTSDDEGVTTIAARTVDAPDAGDAARAARLRGTYVAGRAELDGTFEVVRLRRDRGVMTLVTAGLDERFPPDVLEALVRDYDERAVAKPPPP